MPRSPCRFDTLLVAGCGTLQTMTRAPRLARHRYSYDEYLAYERDSGMKHEYDGGEIRARPSAPATRPSWGSCMRSCRTDQRRQRRMRAGHGGKLSARSVAASRATRREMESRRAWRASGAPDGVSAAV